MHRLARLRGVLTDYTDASGVRRHASPDSLAQVLEALGSPAATAAQAQSSERDLLAAAARRRLEPVTVAWSGRQTHAAITLPSATRGRVSWSIHLESGEHREGSADIKRLKMIRRAGADGIPRPTALLPLPKDLPLGYHRLTIEHNSERLHSTILAAPLKSFRHPRGEYKREWGLFCPAFALRSSTNQGAGTLTDLRALAEWSATLGGRVVGTLPLLATHTGERGGPFDPSPYSPVSRLFWNEMYVDPARLPGFDSCPAAKRVQASAEHQREAASLQRTRLVDYRRAAALNRRLLEPLAESFFSARGETTRAFEAFLSENPLANEFARFRATTEKRNQPWSKWPARLRDDAPRADDYDPRAARYHLYAQYAAWLEMLAMGAEMKAAGGLMYLDLPVGVSPFGFDTWKFRTLFAPCATGAPPDPYFTSGQNWGFPPMHPDACREDGYAYLRACLRAHMRHADYLRLDHVMAFHRLFWIPSGMTAADGVYVRYRDEELYAVLSLESHRGKCRLVGENLGTVPPEVNSALASHDLCGLYVGQYEMQPRKPALRPVPKNCVVSVNTHDMPPIATMWSAGDVDDRIALRMLTKSKRAEERRTREQMKQTLIAFLRNEGLLPKNKKDLANVRDALLLHLARSPADFLLINLEDLWLETHWQNIPGTMKEHPNWRRKLRFTLEQIVGNKAIGRLLSRVDCMRRGRPAAAIRTSNPRRRKKG